MAATEIRAKEANIQIKYNGRRIGGSWSTIKDLSIKPDKTITKKQFPGEKKAVGDLDVKGFDFSFKTEMRDDSWTTIEEAFEQADEAGTDFPDVELSVTYSYRSISARTITKTLHGDLILVLDDSNIPENGYLMNSWSGFCSYWT